MYSHILQTIKIQKKVLKLSLLLIVSLLTIFNLFSPALVQAQALSQADQQAIDNGWVNWVANNNVCGSGSTSSSQTSGSGSNVYILGDSITVRSQSAYQAAFQTLGDNVYIDASVGRGLNTPGQQGSGNGLTGFQAITADQSQIKNAQIIIIALGTNGGDTVQNINQAIQSIHAINSTATIYWIDTISVGRTDGYNQTVIGPANQAIYSQSSTDGYSVISWFKLVDPNGNPTAPSGAEVDPNGYIDNSDGLGVHPDQKGITALVNLVTQTVAGGSNSSSTSSACCAGQPLNGKDIIAQIYNFFLTKGLTAAQISGILGNMYAESGLQPERLENTGFGIQTPAGSLSSSQLSNTSLGWGLVQWTPPSTIISSLKNTDPNQVTNQVNFLWQQLSGDPIDEIALNNLKSTINAQTAAISFEQYYERPASTSDAATRAGYAQGFYLYITQHQPLPPNMPVIGLNTKSSSTTSSTSSATTTSTTSSCSTPYGTGNYQNPFRSIPGIVPERVDQGVDYAGAGPVYAIGNGIITSTTNSGWPGLHGFIAYQLTSGPAKGDYVYVAECMTPTVNVGQTVDANTVIGNMSNCGSGIETGWANPPGNGESLALANNQWDNSDSTAYGVNFNQLLQSLGAPAGQINGTPQGTLPSNWPQW